MRRTCRFLILQQINLLLSDLAPTHWSKRWAQSYLILAEQNKYSGPAIFWPYIGLTSLLEDITDICDQYRAISYEMSVPPKGGLQERFCNHDFLCVHVTQLTDWHWKLVHRNCTLLRNNWICTESRIELLAHLSVGKRNTASIVRGRYTQNYTNCCNKSASCFYFKVISYILNKFVVGVS